ncbi:MAG TPA: DivIVA domain-containing protein [Mycobacteriales bacterium]|nr:DivIVA domain-containing protein [Mycobacteriales bacterium]
MALVIVVLVGIAALTGVAVLLGMSDSPLSTEPVDRLDDGLPDGQLTSHDVGGLRFRIGLRGYRMDDVDLALERLRDALHVAEARSEAAEQALAERSVAARPARTRRPAKKAETPPADGA